MNGPLLPALGDVAQTAELHCLVITVIEIVPVIKVFNKTTVIVLMRSRSSLSKVFVVLICYFFSRAAATHHPELFNAHDPDMNDIMLL